MKVWQVSNYKSMSFELRMEVHCTLCKSLKDLTVGLGCITLHCIILWWVNSKRNNNHTGMHFGWANLNWHKWSIDKIVYLCHGARWCGRCPRGLMCPEHFPQVPWCIYFYLQEKLSLSHRSYFKNLLVAGKVSSVAGGGLWWPVGVKTLWNLGLGWADSVQSLELECRVTFRRPCRAWGGATLSHLMEPRVTRVFIGSLIAPDAASNEL